MLEFFRYSTTLEQYIDDETLSESTIPKTFKDVLSGKLKKLVFDKDSTEKQCTNDFRLYWLLFTKKRLEKTLKKFPENPQPRSTSMDSQAIGSSQVKLLYDIVYN